MRTSDAAVRLVLGPDYDSTYATTTAIETANNLVTRCCDTDDTEYEAADLELIERWLSAHFYAVTTKQRASEKAGSVGESVQYKLGLNLAVTMYGQQALAIDTEGGLASASANAEAGGRRVVGATWLGTNPEPTLEEREAVE